MFLSENIMIFYHKNYFFSFIFIKIKVKYIILRGVDMKKFFKIILAIVLAAAVIAGITSFIYTKSDDYTSDTIPDNTKINGYDCSGLTFSEAEKKLTKEWNSRHIIVTGSLNEKIAGFTDFGCTYDISDQLKTLKHDNIVLAAVNHYFHIPVSFDVAMKIKDYDKKFKKEVVSSDFLNEPGSQKSVNAYVDLSDPDFGIVKEVYGSKPDENKFFKDLLHHIETGEMKLEYDNKNYYSAPEITSDSESLLDYQEFCRKYLSQKITYELGDDTFTLSARQLSKLLKDDLSGDPDEEAVREYVAGLAEKYDNVGIAHEFTSLTGKKVSVTGGTYGWEIAQQDETNKLIENIKSHKDVSRKPVYYVAGYGEYSNDLGDTYIDVDVTAQKVNFFKKGELVFSSSCVTGCKATGHTTDIGTYYIINKVRDVVLKGDNGDGTQYASPVKYWLGVTWTGQGFHDADWRNKFGGKIWLNSGSHGCINMPPKKMPSLYEKAEVGIPVVMHY